MSAWENKFLVLISKTGHHSKIQPNTLYAYTYDDFWTVNLC